MFQAGHSTKTDHDGNYALVVESEITMRQYRRQHQNLLRPRLRKRRRPLALEDMMYLVALMSACYVALMSTGVGAYTPSPLFTSMTSKSRCMNQFKLRRHNYTVLKKSKVEKGGDDEEKKKKKAAKIKKPKIDINILKKKAPVEEEDSGWLTWMVSGRKRGSADIKMREAVELGGVPRSERYSSKYVDKAFACRDMSCGVCI